jgi:energy-coupling factor transport system substrate-specific component
MATTAVKKITSKSWRVVDIVVAALIAIAGGVIFWAWSQGAAAVSAPMNAVYPP